MTPPPLTYILREYEKDNPQKTLRLGQWFFNRFIKNTLQTGYPYNFDLFYNTTDFDIIFTILNQMYDDYRWDKV